MKTAHKTTVNNEQGVSVMFIGSVIMNPIALFALFVTLRDKGLRMFFSSKFISFSCPWATDGNLTSKNLTSLVNFL